jgi:preprotein translocase subunit SecY
MFENLKDALSVPDLRRRILFTGLLLVVYRIGAYIPIPGVDPWAFKGFCASDLLLSSFDYLVCGPLTRLGLFAVGIAPYISALIIFQVLSLMVPRLAKLQKEGEHGRKRINRYICLATALLAAVEGFGIAMGLESLRDPVRLLVAVPGWGFRAVTIVTLSAGTIFLMWMAQQISERGIGAGVAILVFADIVVLMPAALQTVVQVAHLGMIHTVLVSLFLIFMVVVVTAGIILMAQAQRRIPVSYARRVAGERESGDTTTHLPLRVNVAGVIPVISALSIIAMPATFVHFIRHPRAGTVRHALAFGGVWYTLI